MGIVLDLKVIKDMKSKGIVNFDVNWLNFFFLFLKTKFLWKLKQNVQRWTTFAGSDCIVCATKALITRRKTLKIMLLVYVVVERGSETGFCQIMAFEDANYGAASNKYRKRAVLKNIHKHRTLFRVQRSQKLREKSSQQLLY